MDSDSCKQLGISATNYAAEIANYYKEETKLFLDILYRAHVKLHAQFENALVDLYYMFNEYTDKPVNDSSETHSLKQYLSGKILQPLYYCNCILNRVYVKTNNLRTIKIIDCYCISQSSFNALIVIYCDIFDIELL